MREAERKSRRLDTDKGQALHSTAELDALAHGLALEEEVRRRSRPRRLRGIALIGAIGLALALWAALVLAADTGLR